MARKPPVMHVFQNPISHHRVHYLSEPILPMVNKPTIRLAASLVRAALMEVLRKEILD